MRRSERRESRCPACVAVEEITFDDVTFSYIDDREVLNSLSLDVARGEFVAFVGRFGRKD